LQAFVLIRTAAGESEILTLATAPDARRQGMARALLVDAAAAAARQQVTAMFLEVAEDNRAALALYRGLGFVSNGRRPRYYRRSNADWVDAVMLRANIPLGHGNDRRSRLD
jgi:ribosomal-protein-alanine N-acetyltransferase